MIKTQVQIPDHLYDEAKRIAAEYEMSLAEVFRRGLEKMLPYYPPREPAPKTKGWQLPAPQRRGAADFDAAQLRDLARENEVIPSRARRR
ncbi:hypothetical protein OKA05_20425 [Luteolibacter arcticus]|uniref:Uncharacterized protein n=1 Tax=Luteolibacter arcticus TaxID=1581411 RepID=A0ABT3GN36_9BACT|nr:hypothetical protein [Luteolibacter arcticus]MCW1924940.1 hypothetical protein [Luteolibacter arcticus]